MLLMKIMIIMLMFAIHDTVSDVDDLVVDVGDILMNIQVDDNNYDGSLPNYVIIIISIIVERSRLSETYLD